MSGRVVETVFVFDRHAATDLSVAYGILVPERATRPIPTPGPTRAGAQVAAGQEGRLGHDQQQEHPHERDRERGDGHDRQRRPRGVGPRGRAGRRRGPAAWEGQLELELDVGLGLGWAGAADGGDLRAGVLGAAEEGGVDRLPDRGVARVRGRRRVECA